MKFTHTHTQNIHIHNIHNIVCQFTPIYYYLNTKIQLKLIKLSRYLLLIVFKYCLISFIVIQIFQLHNKNIYIKRNTLTYSYIETD